MTEEWKKMNASPEKFLKAENYVTKPFSGVLETIYPSETQSEKAVPLIRLDFEDGSSLSIFGLDKRNDDGTYPFALGAFIKSVEALGLEMQQAEVDGIVQGIRITENTIPLERPKIWMRGIEDKTVGADSQTKSYFKWGILEKYENTSTKPTKIKPGQYSKKPVVKDTSVRITELIDMILEPKTISELFVGLGKKYKVSELRVALDKLKAEGIVKQDNDKYVVI